MEDLIAESRGRGLAIMPVAKRDVTSFSNDLAGFAKRNVIASFVHDANFYPGNGLADGIWSFGYEIRRKTGEAGCCFCLTVHEENFYIGKGLCQFPNKNRGQMPASLLHVAKMGKSHAGKRSEE